MLKTSLSLGFLLLSQWALAALPPLSGEVRESMAAGIFEGTVLKIESEISKDRRFPDYENRIFMADVSVSKVIKGDLATAGETAKITYWRPAKRPRGFVGAQGQNTLPHVGDEGRFYAHATDFVEEASGLLEPNGWERLGEPQPAFHMSAQTGEDSTDWHDVIETEDPEDL